jgi:hypothetical protein
MPKRRPDYVKYRIAWEELQIIFYATAFSVESLVHLSDPSKGDGENGLHLLLNGIHG